MKSTSSEHVLIAENRKAHHRYTIEEQFEAGIVLIGSEVKSLRQGHCQLADAYVYVHQHELFLAHAHIAAYTHGGYTNHTPDRVRKLLMHQREIDKISEKLTRRGYTLIPLSLYFKRGRVKVKLGLAVGKNSVDRRETLKAREDERAIAQVMKKNLRAS